MRKWIDIGTDIATIGVWDPARERHDLFGAKYADFKSALEAEAFAGRLFFVNTSADGGYPAVIYTEELPDMDTLHLYDEADRRFLIHCHSGRMIAGGIEDFINDKNQITSTDDEFPLAPGSYEIQFYELTEQKMMARLRAELGLSDYEYYSDRAERLPWGCLLAATVCLATILLLVHFFVAALTLFIFGFACALVRRQKQAGDRRFNSIKERVKAFEKEIPPFIYVLQSVEKSTETSGGWHDLM